MISFPMYQVDVFTKEQFKGNPAAVCLLDREIEEIHMKGIAAEMNLSETAFLLPIDKDQNKYSLRWFTPEVEVSLCGHGTIGTAKILFDEMGIKSDEIYFETKSGTLIARRYAAGIGIDMPLDNPMDIKPTEELLNSIGINEYEDVKIGETTRKMIIIVNNDKEILELKPNFDTMRNLSLDNIKGVAVTTKNTNDFDFISRYFNPWAGINEDPVTGSVHTVLANYWGHILAKKEMKAYQASSRGGELILRLIDDERLDLIGQAIIVLKGEINIPE